MIQYQILQIDIIIVWQTVRRITNEILGVKGLTCYYAHMNYFRINGDCKVLFSAILLLTWF